MAESNYLTAAQVEYAREMLDTARQTRLAAITAKHTVLGVKLTFEQMQVALCEGRFVADKQDTRPWTSGAVDVRDLVDFTDETKTVANEAAILAETQPLEDAYQKARDALILGSAPKALAMIREFAAAP